MYRLHTDIRGSGPTIVLLHGFLSSSRYFKRVIDQLARHYTVVSVDLLGHGKSPKNVETFDITAQAAALKTTLKDLGIDRPHAIIGHSMGSLVALRFLKQSPRAAGKLILINPPMFRSHDQAYTSITSTGKLYRTMLFSRYRRILWQAFRVATKLPAPLRRSVLGVKDMAIVPTKARDDALQAIMSTDFFAALDAITIPTLVIVGERDRSVYHENIANWTPPGNTMLSINPYGHHSILFQSKIILPEILDFLSSK